MNDKDVCKECRKPLCGLCPKDEIKKKIWEDYDVLPRKTDRKADESDSACT